MIDQFKRILKLVKKTKDRVVVYNETNPEETSVIMSFDEYEKIMFDDSRKDLTEDELIDKINRDISEWKTGQELQEDDAFEARMDENYGVKKAKNSWKISRDAKEGAEEVIEEDRQYLENIE